ncbi:MAG: methylated-DNA--[protein]-cysteine S-methyltransferase [Thermoanaerobaculia bacterium]
MSEPNGRQALQDYRRVERAIRFLEANLNEQPSLEEMAAAVGLSQYHFHRLFSRWAGTTPKRFLQYLTAQYAKQQLRRSKSVLEATWEAGLSSPGRLHDLLVSVEAVSPGEYKGRGAGLTIRWGIHPSPFGSCLLAVTERGICGLEFLADRAPAAAADHLQARWSEAELRRAPRETAALLRRIFSSASDRPAGPLHLMVQGTNFQLQVWQALLRIPAGAVITYGELARQLGRPQASRAVGGAVGRNPIAYLIPCHRVIRAVGGLGGYRWGRERKQALLAWEAAGLDSAAAS